MMHGENEAHYIPDLAGSLWHTSQPITETHIKGPAQLINKAMDDYKNAALDDVVDFMGILMIERRHVLSVRKSPLK